MFSELFHVGDAVPGDVVGEAGMWRALPQPRWSNSTMR
jgi:hypothetical protein